MTRLTLLILLGLAVPVGAGAHPGHDGPGGPYSLFRPAPPEHMRELSTDRPDRTESAYTVDAGHFQVELDAVSWTRDRPGGVKVDGFGIVAANVKLGLADRIDVQLVVESWLRERIEDLGDTGVTGQPVTRSGFGDVTARVKINLFGNDRGSSALAVMPFVAWPTAQNDLGREDLELGLIVPLALELPAGWGMGIMGEVDVTPDASSEVWVASITASHDIAGSLGGYLELFGAWPDAGEAQGTFDLGLTYGIGRNVQLDGGANIGVTDATEDLAMFLGVSFRR